MFPVASLLLSSSAYKCAVRYACNKNYSLSDSVPFHHSTQDSTPKVTKMDENSDQSYKTGVSLVCSVPVPQVYSSLG